MSRHDPRDRRTVVRVDRSPMNSAIWCIALACGHEVWKPQRTRPAVKTLACPTCKAARKANGEAKES